MFDQHHSSMDNHPDYPKTSVPNFASNQSLTPQVVNGQFYAKVPVVLAETTVQIPLDSHIKFPEPVLEIKQVKKNLKVTQCRLLLPTRKLFIKGFVRKNIQYAAPVNGNKKWVESKIKSLTVDIPFSVYTEVDFINQPQFSTTPTTQNFSYFKSQPLPSGFSQKDQLLSGDLSEFNQISGEVFNELPYCELLSSQFVEMDEYLDQKMGDVYNEHNFKIDAPFEEGSFQTVEEKMVIELSLKVLQNQQASFGNNSSDDDC
ncbi:DUF3794 domain-containing protein [Pullulanibacillus sp. KACC 23026]|uniref:CsxC family protein n=1 Tax=Pullulanibacillus sp. KACC 23026 TaxID=3028315 RepID=UPI0023B1B014|nr:DUF3794 domain-containing protein [Pullulanibacillus sp. KACC 23026]WEG14843.1 DUF3794 domain-containing protein [Pullulanibacillus sp. KACC 23026]